MLIPEQRLSKFLEFWEMAVTQEGPKVLGAI